MCETMCLCVCCLRTCSLSRAFVWAFGPAQICRIHHCESSLLTCRWQMHLRSPEVKATTKRILPWWWQNKDARLPHSDVCACVIASMCKVCNPICVQCRESLHPYAHHTEWSQTGFIFHSLHFQTVDHYVWKMTCHRCVSGHTHGQLALICWREWHKKGCVLLLKH